MPGPIHKLLALMTRRDRVQLYFLLVSLVLMAAVEIAGIASILPFMAVVTNPETIHTSRYLNMVYQELGFDSDRSFLIFLGVMLLVLIITSNVIKAVNSWLTLRYHNKLYHLFARRLLAQYMARPYSYFLNQNTSELGKNILAEVSSVISNVLSPGTQLLSSGLVSVAIMGLLIVVDPITAIVIASVLGGVYSAVYISSRRKLAIIGKEQVHANSEKFKAAGEALSGIKDLKVLGREQTFLHRFAHYAQKHAHNNVTAGLIAEMPRFALEIIAFGGILGVTLHLLSTGQQASAMVPILALYAFAGYRLMPALQLVFASLTKVRFSMASLDILYRDLVVGQSSIEQVEATLAAPARTPPMPFREGLELRNVSFQYEGAPEPSLRDISLTIPANACVGFVGTTGAGKTTTVDILLGLLSPSGGAVLADGVPVKPENLVAWQKNLGYVPQHIFICDDTVARNIAFGVPEDQMDMAAVRRAARIANLETFVDEQLPEGFDTVIGEHGIRLSGGQRQRIGIARALYRDPAVLVLDEATSALDGITEEAVMEAVRTLAKKKTIILIAHRLTTVRSCDTIYLLERGSIRTQGTYDDLMRESSWFRAAAGSKH